MRIGTQRTLAFRSVGIQLSKREREILASASRIAERARDLASEKVGPDFEATYDDLWLAQVEHNCARLADDGFILLTEDLNPLI